MKSHRVLQTIIVCTCLAFSAGCGTKRSRSKARAEPTEAMCPCPSSEGGMGNPLGNLGFFGAMLEDRMEEPGPYDERRESEDFDGDDPHFGVLELSGPIVEIEAFSLLSSTGGVELRTLTNKLTDLSKKDEVAGLIVRLGDLSMSMATAEELRGALVRFKGEGKRQLACHVEQTSNQTYYVLTACDTIAVAPVGEVVVSGVAAAPIHMKEMLGELGIEADFVHIGAYKGAAEPLTRDAPSPELRETVAAILDQYFETMVAGIAQGRSLEPDAVRALIDTALFRPEQAVAAKLVDRVQVYDEFRDEVVGEHGWHRVTIGDDGSGPPDVNELMEFIGIKPRPRPSGPHVALVHAVGNIIDGKGEGLIGARAEIASRTLTAAIDALARDDSVAAIVLRVDSGGGSALASELILHSLDRAKAKKPVVVSMGGMAASGGYYISSHASRIFASRTTLTGSIGVVGGKLVIEDTLDKLGISAYPMGRGKRALMSSMLTKWTPEEKALVEAQMRDVYDTFVNHVAAGRSKDYETVHVIAQGRVWTGEAALERGLIDEIGGLEEALAAARELGDVDPDVDLEVYPPEPTLIDILGTLGQGSSSVSVLAGMLEPGASGATWLAQVASVLGAPEAQAIEATLRRLALLQESRVATTVFFPVVFR